MKLFERHIGHFCLAILLLCVVGVAQAQQATVNFTVTPATGTRSVTPVATWSTSPTGATCTASGGWTGSKASSGTQTLPAITQTTDYHLDCVWPRAAGKATVSWTAPLTNTDGTPLADLSSFKILFGTSATNLNQTALVAGADATSGQIDNLTPNTTWYFAVRAVNSKGAESDNSAVVPKLIAGGSQATVEKTATVTVEKVPAPPSGVTVVERVTANANFSPVYRVVNGNERSDGVLGLVPVGRACTGKVMFRYRGMNFRRVEVKPGELWGTTDTRNLAAPCA